MGRGGNVADAVGGCSVNSESSSFQGASMQECGCFSGTELRKPLGYAYVAITLDNSDHSLAIDYDEVTVCQKALPVR